MKQERSGISLLLGLLLLLSTCISMLYAQTIHDTPVLEETKPAKGLSQALELPAPVKDGASSAELASDGGLSATQFRRAMHMIMPLVESESVEKIVEIVRGTLPDLSLKIVRALIDNRGLSRDDLVHLLLGIAQEYSSNKKDQDAFFNLIQQNSYLHTGAPLLYVAAKSNLAQIIPNLLLWINEQVEQGGEWLAHAQDDALTYAVLHDRLKLVQILQEQGVVITPVQATQLLWLVVENKKNVTIAKFLLKNGAHKGHAHDGHTLLVQAVKNLDFPMIELLINAGVNVNALADNAVGSALQTILEMEYKATDSKSGDRDKMIAIENYLRAHGADENILLWKYGSADVNVLSRS